MHRKSVARVLTLSALISASPTHAGFLQDLGGHIVGGAASFAGGILGGGGGGGSLGGIIGLPGQEAFGGAINKWEEANNRTLGKLNTTVDQWGNRNDNTIKLLNQGMSDNLDKAQSIVSGTVFEQQNAIDTLDKANEILSNQVDDLDLAFSSAVGGLDQSFSNAVSSLDESLTKQTGRLDTVGVRFSVSLEAAARGVLILAGAIALLVTAYRIFLTPAVSGTRRRRERFAIACSIALAALILTPFLFPATGQADRLAQKYESQYYDDLRQLNLAQASYNAAQLDLLRPGDLTPRYLGLKADLVRQALFKPSAAASLRRQDEFDNNLDQASSFVTGGVKAIQVDPDLLILKARQVAQTEPSQLGLLQAAALSVQAMKIAYPDTKAASLNPLRTHVLTPLALSYIRAYRESPISASFIYDLPLAPEETRTSRSAWLTELNEWQIPTSAAAGLADQPAGLTYLARRAGVTRRLYLDVLPAYYSMIEEASRLRINPGQSALIQSKVKSDARYIIQRFDGFASEVEQQGLSDQSILLDAGKGLFVVYARAKAYLSADLNSIKPDSIPDSVVESSIHRIWAARLGLGSLTSPITSTGAGGAPWVDQRLRKGLLKLTEAGFVVQNSTLKEFERDVFLLESEPAESDQRSAFASKAAKEAGELELFCRSVSSNGTPSLVPAISCIEDGIAPKVLDRNSSIQARTSFLRSSLVPVG